MFWNAGYRRDRCGRGPWAYAYATPAGSCGYPDERAAFHSAVRDMIEEQISRAFMSRDWWNFGPREGHAAWGFGPSGRFFEGGEVRLAILSLLSEGPKHGYQLMKELKERSGGMYRASAGTVYPTLQMLEDEGLIEATSAEGRRVFRLTDAGRAELARDPEAVRRIWERAKGWEDWGQYCGPDVLAFLAPIASLNKAVFRAAKWAAGAADRDAKVREAIQRAIRELEDLAK